MGKRKDDVSSKYKKLDDIEHVLLRPGRYIGSTAFQTSDEWILEGKFCKQQVTYIPAFIKLFDEVITNSVDEHVKNKSINLIKVTIDKTDGSIIVFDNGGIPVQIHDEYKEYIPEMIFANLRSGSNLDDENAERTGGGLHGEGVTLTNIYSKKFIIETADKKKRFIQEFSNNMKDRKKPKIGKLSRGYTKITYIPDYERLKMDGLDDDHFKMIRKRCIDIAGCNPKLKIILNDEEFRFKSFKEYISLYGELIAFEENEHWQIGMGVGDNTNEQISFVNSVCTKDGGPHVNHIQNNVANILRPLIKRKFRVDVQPKDLRNQMFTFVNATIINPAFSSQTKEKLITEYKDFGYILDPSEKFCKEILKSEIVQKVLDWIDRKNQAKENEELRRLNKNIGSKKVLKLVDAKSRTRRDKCTLGIFEGDSAISAVRQYRDPQRFGAFPLKGKSLPNVLEMTNANVIQKQVIIDLIAAIGLRLGHEATVNELRYGKIYIYTDADPDGDNIAGLFINFLGKYWPELFDMGVVHKVMTPLVVCKRGSKSINFYTDSEFNHWLKGHDHKAWQIEYKKGLAALNDEEYEEIIKNPYVVKLVKDKESKTTLYAWFGPDSQLRKDKILGSNLKK